MAFKLMVARKEPIALAGTKRTESWGSGEAIVICCLEYFQNRAFIVSALYPKRPVSLSSSSVLWSRETSHRQGRSTFSPLSRRLFVRSPSLPRRDNMAGKMIYGYKASRH